MLMEEILELPLFLDTVFTLTVTFAAGLVPGILTAALTTLAIGLWRYPFLGIYLYVLCSIAAAWLVWAFRDKIIFTFPSRRSSEFQFSVVSCVSVLVCLSVLMCLLMSVTGGLISYVNIELLQNPESSGSPETPFYWGLILNGFSVLPASILARIPVNILDRFISVFAGYGTAFAVKKFAAKNPE
jgi:hypothetical protein